MPNAPPTTHRISEFYKWHKEGCLKLAPPFQRKPVWSDKNKSFLIDSILENFPVPEIYIQVKTDQEGNTEYIVVDGQQRMRSILEFLEGEYALLEDESSNFGGKEFKDLPSGVRTDFWDFPIVTRELKTEKKSEIQSIFLRLNKYVIPLNHQELRNATYRGHLITLVNKIAEEDDFWAENKIVTPSQIKRMLDAEFISELFIAMIHGIQQKSHESIDGFYLMYDEKFQDKEDLKKKFMATENRIAELFGDYLEKCRWRKQPDFYSLFIAVYELSQNYYFPEDRFEEIRENLLNFATQVDIFVKDTTKEASDRMVKQYVDNVIRHTTDKGTRTNRYQVIRELLIPYLVARDTKRNFTEEERRIAWNLSKDKKCAICGNVIESMDDYELDHILPYSKGGKTELKNSQITHKSCNAKKSNKTENIDCPSMPETK